VTEQLPPTSQQSVGQLFRRIVNGLNDLVDRQIELAKQEAKEDVLDALRASKTLAIGVGIALAGVLILLDMLTMTIVLSLNVLGARFIPIVGPWLGWLVVLVLLVALFLAALGVIKRGLRDIRVSPIDRTRQTLKEDAEWAQRLLTRNGK